MCERHFGESSTILKIVPSQRQAQGWKQGRCMKWMRMYRHRLPHTAWSMTQGQGIWCTRKSRSRSARSCWAWRKQLRDRTNRRTVVSGMLWIMNMIDHLPTAERTSFLVNSIWSGAKRRGAWVKQQQASNADCWNHRTISQYLLRWRREKQMQREGAHE